MLATLREHFQQRIAPADLIVVAFSGGPDSCALLWGLSRLASQLDFRLHAGHFDHGLDADSAHRALAAGELSRSLGVAFSSARATGSELLRGSEESPEAHARQLRYAFLNGLARRLGARYLATAHHADDQAETVLLRMLFGSGLAGLAAMQAHRGYLSRPLLGLSRQALQAALASSRVKPLSDPTNADLRVPRNRVRHCLLPRLRERLPDITPRLCRLAAAAARARHHLEQRLQELLQPQPTAHAIELDRQRLVALPSELRPAALAMLHHRAGAAYPPPLTARRELDRQLSRGTAVGCDCGDGWRWDGDSKHLWLHRQRPALAAFTYTLTPPGSVDLAEVGLRFHLQPAAIAPWMYRYQPRRVGLWIRSPPLAGVEIRSRRPGDRIHPLGCSGRRRLKKVLIDRRMPRFARDFLPLLIIRGELAWVPGVALAESCRLPPADSRASSPGQVWVARTEAL